ncbi:MAG: aspartate-semialdehyde dehydrogenase [Terriglobales bacterium]
MTEAKLPVGVLGATGAVGQWLLAMLDRHPWFEPVWVAASERSRDRRYGEATRWRLPARLSERVANLPVSEATPAGCPARVIFASVDSAAARALEPAFAAAGHRVISNSSALRMEPDVPLVVPECNPDHLALIERQPSFAKNGGYAVTNPNCCTAGLAMALAPLAQAFGIESVFVVTMQALSGAGYPGVASLDALGNVIPYIAHEEDKLQAEAQKVLGQFGPAGIIPADFTVSAHCNRVAVVDGHMESVSVKLRSKAGLAEVAAAMRDFTGEPQQLQLPSAPTRPLEVAAASDRPQPRLDVLAGGGMTVTVGRLRPCPLLDYKFTVLSHNMVRGAAGAAILNAELLHAHQRL